MVRLLTSMLGRTPCWLLWPLTMVSGAANNEHMEARQRVDSSEQRLRDRVLGRDRGAAGAVARTSLLSGRRRHG